MIKVFKSSKIKWITLSKYTQGSTTVNNHLRQLFYKKLWPDPYRARSYKVDIYICHQKDIYFTTFYNAMGNTAQGINPEK